MEGYEMQPDGTLYILRKNGILYDGTRGLKEYEEKVKKLRIGGGLRKIAKNCFAKCSGLREVTLDGVMSIGEFAFDGCGDLEKVNLGNKMFEIGWRAFRNCSRLKEVLFPAQIHTVDGWAFLQCASLEHVVLPAGLGALQVGTFAECTSLREVELPDGLKKISEYAFWNCKSLERIRIPDTVTVMEERAFEGCVNLREIRIPVRLDFKINSVLGCTSLEQIEFAPGHKEFRSSGAMVLDLSGKTLMFAVQGVRGTCEIPAGVEKVVESSFYSCPHLEKVIMPDSVKYLGEWCFGNSHSLKEIRFSDNLDSIPVTCCINDTSLRKVTLPKKLRWIGQRAFQNTGLEELVLPASLEYMGTSCLRGAPLNRLIFEGTDLGILDTRSIGLNLDGLALRADHVDPEDLPKALQKPVLRDYVLRKENGEPVPAEMEEWCRSCLRKSSGSLWKEPVFRNQLLALGAIGARDFKKLLEQAEQESDTELVAQLLQYQHAQGLDEELNRREAEKLKRDMRQLTRETPTAGELRAIWTCRKWDSESDYVCSYRGAEEEVVVPAVIGKRRIAGILEGAFSTDSLFGKTSAEVRTRRENIRSIIVPEGIQVIGAYAFAGCINLKQVKLPRSVRVIEEGAFRLTALQELEIPDQVLWIGAYVFPLSMRRVIIRGAQTELARRRKDDEGLSEVIMSAPEESRARCWAKENKVLFYPFETPG